MTKNPISDGSSAYDMGNEDTFHGNMVDDYKMFMRYKYGETEGENTDPDLAFVYLTKAARGGHGGAMAQLVEYFSEGNYSEKNIEKAKEYCIKAAEKGSIKAMKCLGHWYANGDEDLGIKKDNSSAVYWYRKAAERGDAFSQFIIGKVYEKGLNNVLEADCDKAMVWYLEAARGGSNIARYRLGEYFMRGHMVEPDKRTAFRWFLKAAQNGDKKSQTKLYHCYKEGILVEQDDVLAEYWQKKAQEE